MNQQGQAQDQRQGGAPAQGGPGVPGGFYGCLFCHSTCGPICPNRQARDEEIRRAVQVACRAVRNRYGCKIREIWREVQQTNLGHSENRGEFVELGGAGMLTLIHQEVVRDHLRAALLHIDCPLQRGADECEESDSGSEEANQ